MEWRTSLSDADYYINSSNSNDVKLKNLGPEDLINRTREYKLIDIEEPNNSSNGLLDDDMDIIILRRHYQRHQHQVQLQQIQPQLIGFRFI